MKKSLVMLLLLVAIFGAFSMTAQADPQGTCGSSGTPVDVLCTYDHDNNPETASLACLVWINIPDDPAGTGVICEVAPA